MKCLVSLALVIMMSVFLFGCDNGNNSKRESNYNQNEIKNEENGFTGNAFIYEKDGLNLLFGTIGNATLKLENNGEVSVFDVEHFCNIHTTRSVIVNDVIYCSDYGSSFEKCRLEGNTLEREQWIEDDVLKNNEVINEALEAKEKYVQYINNFKTDGKFVYCTIYYNGREDSIKPIANRLCRISLDGKTIEFVGDIIATDYEIYQNNIYYFDNGLMSDGSIDDSRIGLYKASMDGGNIECINKGFGEKRDLSYEEDEEICSNLLIKNDKIYFIDNTVSGEGRVCCVDLNGKNYKYITENKVICYGFDSKGDYIFFIEYIKMKFCRQKINGEDYLVCFEPKISIGNGTFQEFNNCIYFNYNGVVCIKYDMKNNKGYLLKVTYQGERSVENLANCLCEWEKLT